MVSFVIFWSAALAMFFFVLGIIFKALASAFKSLLTSLNDVLAVGGLASLAGIVLYLLYAIIAGITEGGFWSFVEALVIITIIIGIIVAIIGGLGIELLALAAVAVGFVIDIVSAVLEWTSKLCERNYVKFLRIIMRQVDKC